MSGRQEQGLPGNGAIDRGFASGESCMSLKPPGAHNFSKDGAQRAGAQTPPEMCVYDKLPFVHSDVSALEVILLKGRCFLKGGAVSRDLHR